MTRPTHLASVLVLIGLAVFVVGCSDDSSTFQPGPSGQSEVDIAAALADIPLGEPSAAEIATLVFMREEEKLAYDVYQAMYELYAQKIFTNIAAAEQKHTDSVFLLIERYELEDPVGENDPGIFADETLQGLYDDLIASGEQSLTEGLLAGLAIEEIDILDLIDAKANTELPDFLLVYDSLLNGSYNHLQAFSSNYESQTGETYVPRWLSQEAYDTILSMDTGRGGRGGR